MGQKVHPIGFRIGITEDWRSRWFAPKAAFAEFLIEDHKIRNLIDVRLNRTPPFAGCAVVEIGPRGAEVDKLREAIEEMIDRKVSVNIKEIKNPDLCAQLIAFDVAEQLKRRSSFRRVMKMRCDAAVASGALGVKILCKGRLGGAEMSRTEVQKRGSIPLQTLQAHVDFGFTNAFTTYGAIGVSVWIYRGNYGEEVGAEEAPPRSSGARRRL